MGEDAHQASSAAGLRHFPSVHEAQASQTSGLSCVRCGTVQGLGGSCLVPVGPPGPGGPRGSDVSVPRGSGVSGPGVQCEARGCASAGVGSLLAADTQCSLSFIRIEEELGSKARFAGRNFRNPRVN